MPTLATVPQSANYAPKATLPEGLHQVVIFRVEDLGMVPLGDRIVAANRAQAQKEGRDPNTVKTAQPKARVFFNNDKGQYITRDYTLSLHKKAALAIDLTRIGKTFGQSFDVESLVGTQAQVMTEEAISDRGNKYVKIATLAKPAAGQSVTPLANRPVGEGATAAPAVKPDALASTYIDDSDIPF